MPKLNMIPSELLERYPCVCAVCSGTIYIAPSIMMQKFGENIGSGSCPKCKTYLHLEIASDNKSMISVSFSAWKNEQELMMNINTNGI